MNVAEKVVLITGAARGIGLGIGQVLVRKGAKVVLVDKSPEVAAAAAAIGPAAHGICCDVSEMAANREMVAEAVRAFGRVDALVASAAASRRGPFLEITEEDLQFTLATSLFGAFYSCQAAARQMVAQGGGGSLLIIGSVHVHRHYPNSSGYNMAKAALSSLSRTIASELAPHRIRVNTILPGWTDTPGELAFATADELRRGGESIPAGRLATPEDIGNAALYLLSDEASYVTGSELMVDGGITLSTQSSSSR
jgi:glucose 1-dehydrogenase